MRSYLLIYFRHAFNYERKYIAEILDITTQDYRRLESGEELMDREDALRLGKLFDAPAELFLNESQLLHGARNKIAQALFYRGVFNSCNEESEDQLYGEWEK